MTTQASNPSEFFIRFSGRAEYQDALDHKLAASHLLRRLGLIAQQKPNTLSYAEKCLLVEVQRGRGGPAWRKYQEGSQ